jgi:nucleobase:cation symporter-1, NCS1 family
MVVLATMATNVAANVVSPSYDFSSAAPKLISFRAGGLITGVLGVVIFPWKLYTSSPGSTSTAACWAAWPPC